MGVIGLGYWGKILCKTIASSDGMSLHAVADRHPDNFPAASEIVKYTDSSELIHDPEIELVVIATQTSSHKSLVRQALDSGKNVFVEKPFTGSAAVARELTELAKSKNLRIFVDMPYLFSKKMEIIKRALAGKTVNLVKMRRCDFGKFPRDAGIFPHLMFHDFYIVNHLFGGLKAKPGVIAEEGRLISPWQPDWGVVQFSLVGGPVAHITCDMTCLEKVRQIEFHCEEGHYFWDDLKKDWFVFQKKRAELQGDRFLYLATEQSRFAGSDFEGEDNPLLQQFEYVFECLKKGTVAINDASVATTVLGFIDEFHRS